MVSRRRGISSTYTRRVTLGHNFARAVRRVRLVRFGVRVAVIMFHVLLGRVRVVSLAATGRRRHATRAFSATVVCHVYYLELFDQLLEASVRAPFARRVLFTCPHDRHKALLDLVSQAVDRFPSVAMSIESHDNVGRDVLPFLSVVHHPWVREADLVLKIHSKRSPHLVAGKGDQWRTSLLTALSPTSDKLHRGLEHILARAASTGKPRLIWPARWAYSAESWGANRHTTQRLWREHRSLIKGPLLFPAGSMFWCNREYINSLVALPRLSETHNTHTPGPLLDGALAHGVERAFGQLALEQGRAVLTL